MKASKAYKAIKDEMAVGQRVLDMDARPDQVYGSTQAQLSVMLSGTDNAIKQSRKIRDDKTTPSEEREKAGHRVILLEKWYSILLEFQTTRALGQAIDPRDNGYVRWRDKAARRQPKLKAALPRAEAAMQDAARAHEQCLAGRSTSGSTTTTSTGPDMAERVYLTSFGELKLSIRDSAVFGTYAVQSGPRFANGVDPTGGGTVVGRIDGRRTDNVVEGYWHQPSGADRCSSPRNGYPSWGRYRWEFRADGSFAGKRGVCETEPAAEWNGQPRN